MKNNNHFDFVEFAYERLTKNFHNCVLLERTITMKSIYRMCGLLFSLNKYQTRMLIADLSRRYVNVERNCRGLKIFKL